jgi:hypothetical protein
VRSLLKLMWLCLSLHSAQSLAVTECAKQVHHTYVGDEGNVWMFYLNGGSAFSGPADSDTKNIYVTALIALTTGRSVTVRYVADGISCASENRGDIVGVYLF